MPQRIVLVGGGYIAAEFSHLAARAGARVTVLQRNTRMRPAFDPDLVEWLTEKFDELGIELRTRSTVQRVEETAGSFLVQANTRRYHGLLVASLRPPVERILMVAKIDATAGYAGKSFALACNEFADGTLTPRGFELLCGFEMVRGIPVWTYALADARLEQRIWMEHGFNIAYMSLTLRKASGPVTLELVPLCTTDRIPP